MKRLVALCFVPMLAFATGSHDNGNPNTAAQSQSHAQAASAAVAGAQAKQAQIASSDQSLTSTNTATGGAGGAGGNGGQGGAGGVANQSQQASNAGNSQHITIQGARQIASLSQGSWAAPSCGSGGNAGGSGSHGAGFLGAYWTPADCKLMQIAYTWAHVGMYGEACKTLTATKTLRKAYGRYQLPLPDCAALIAALTAPEARLEVKPEPAQPDMSLYYTKPEVDERLERQFKQGQSK